MKIFFASFIFFILSANVFGQSKTILDPYRKFEIVYLADIEYANNEQWLTNIRNIWQATGINLRIWWLRIKDPDGNCNWENPSYNFDDAIRKIAAANLDIYIRVNFTLTNKHELKNYTNDDFHKRSNGKIFLNVYNNSLPLLNITSKNSVSHITAFLSKLITHLNQFPPSIRNRIKVIVPTLSPDDETELTFNTYDDSVKINLLHVLTGFSNPEIDGFINYLRNKYESVAKLNGNWKSLFKSFDKQEINIKNYNWDGIKTNPDAKDYYLFENGRKDFLDFRRDELKKFLDICSRIVKQAGYKFGIQFGSMYDEFVEFRGFYEPTPLIENSDLLITDEIVEYYPNFEFSAVYSRSLCKYWKWKTKKNRYFGTETNWIGYEGHTPYNLINFWSMQLRTFYENGASYLFISHWGTTDSPTGVPKKIISNSGLAEYKAWQDTLQKYRKAPVRKIISYDSYHLACEHGLNFNKQKPEESFEHNKGMMVDKVDGKYALEFPLSRFTKERTHGSDFITSYMLKNSPDYIRKMYKKFLKTRTSNYIDSKIKFEF